MLLQIYIYPISYAEEKRCCWTQRNYPGTNII